MSNWVIALLGGISGSLFLLLIRALAIPLEIQSHDRAVQERDRDLEQWVADDHLRLKRQLARIVNDLAASGGLSSGAAGVSLGQAKERALHAYRDQEAAAHRDLARIYDREGWAHLLYRRVRKRPQLCLTAPNRVRPVLDVWRLPITRHLGPGDEPQPILDPTTRSLDDVHQELAADREAFT